MAILASAVVARRSRSLRATALALVLSVVEAGIFLGAMKRHPGHDGALAGLLRVAAVISPLACLNLLRQWRQSHYPAADVKERVEDQKRSAPQGNYGQERVD